MDDGDLSARLDLHLERIDGHMERGNELMGEIREEMRMSRQQRERSDEALDHHARMYADLRRFTRDMVRRMERVTQAQIGEMRGLSSAVERQTADLGAELRDMREESRAQRSALLRLIDRFDRPEPGGSSAPA